MLWLVVVDCLELDVFVLCYFFDWFNGDWLILEYLLVYISGIFNYMELWFFEVWKW